MDIEVIKEKYRLGEYNCKMIFGVKLKSDHIFDEELSVRRNREMVDEYNAEVESQRKEAYTKQAELDKKLAHDICCYITENYDMDYATASRIQHFCYTEKHHDMNAYFDYIDIIADFVDSIINPD